MKRPFLFAACALLVSAAAAPAQNGQPGEDGMPVPEPGVERAPRMARADLGFGISVTMAVLSESDITPVDYPRVASIRAGSSAERAGLLLGDVILTVDGRNAKLGGLFLHVAPGDKFVLHVRRGEKEMDVAIVAAPPRAPGS